MGNLLTSFFFGGIEHLRPQQFIRVYHMAVALAHDAWIGGSMDLPSELIALDHRLTTTKGLTFEESIEKKQFWDIHIISYYIRFVFASESYPDWLVFSSGFLGALLCMFYSKPADRNVIYYFWER